MSRLQEYLKTPNPLHPEFFSPRSCQPDHTHNLFADHEALITKGPEDSAFQAAYRSPVSLPRHRRSPTVVMTPYNSHKPIQEKLEFEDGSQQQIRTPVVRNQRKTLLQTTATKKYDLRALGNLQTHPNDNKEGERTLRVLSSEAYNIVCEKGATTYKQVSEEIINNTSDIPSVKEQKNIKRRVYDALNVLIALGKLEKKGRKIIPHKNFEIQKSHQQKIMELKRLLIQKQNLLKAKKKLFKNQIKKSNSLKKLMERNLSSKNKISHEQQIPMPFIITHHCNIQTMDEEKSVIQIKMQGNQNGTVYGDLDVLNLIRFQSR